MKIKIFTLNKNGKIELTKEHLQQLVDDAYHEGCLDGQKHNWWWYNNSYITTTTPSNIGDITTTKPWDIQTVPSSICKSDSSSSVKYSSDTTTTYYPKDDSITIASTEIPHSQDFYINVKTDGDPR